MNQRSFEKLLSNQQRHWWHRGKRKVLSTLIQKKANLPGDSRILEIGCGMGGNLEMLSRFGHLTALEFDDYARSRIPPVEGVKIFKGRLPDGLHSIEGQAFDLICLFDVLEHIEHDGDALFSIRNFLKPGAKVLLTVPAYQWMFSVHDVNFGHYRRYNRRGLSLKCRDAGFKILHAGYMNMCTLPLMAAARLLDKIRKKSSSTGSSVPPAWLNGALYHLFALESLWIPHLRTPAGGSVVVLAEKMCI